MADRHFGHARGRWASRVLGCAFWDTRIIVDRARSRRSGAPSGGQRGATRSGNLCDVTDDEATVAVLSRFRWQEHLALILTALFFAMFLVKVAAVAHGDSTTSLALLQRTSPAAVLFGVGALIGVWYLLGLGGSALIAVVSRTRRGSQEKGRAEAAVIGYAALIALLTSAAFGIAVAVLLSGWLWWPSRPGTRGQSDSSAPLPSFYQMAFVWLIALTLTATDRVWLPREVLELRNGQTAVGYVLDADDSSFVILHDRSRTVERIKTSDVMERSYCSLGKSWWERPVTALSESERPTYPRCPNEK